MPAAASQRDTLDLRSLGAVPFGIVTVAIMIALEVYTIAHFDFSLTGTSMFLIIPIGAFIVGALAATGMAGALWVLQIRPSIVAFVAAVLLGVACFGGIYYGTYDRTFVDETGAINYNGEGDHIGQFVNIETGEAMTFWRYLKLDVSTREMSIFSSRSLESQTVSFDRLNAVGNWLNWGLFGLEAFGVIIGSYTMVALVGKMEYCAACKRYMRSNGTVKITPEALPTVWARLRGASPDQASLNAATIDTAPGSDKQPHIVISASHCTECRAGVITAQSFTKKNDRNRYVEVSKERRSMGVASPVSGIVPQPVAGLSADYGD